MTILLFFAVLFVLILVHELGHFIVAKRTGMRVDEFGIGFPPKLFGIRKGETEYTINALPIGGFVRIYGEDAVQVEREGGNDQSRAFVSRSKWAQTAVLIAGVTANVLFAWLLFTIVLTTGTNTVVSEEEATPEAALTVLSVLPESPAADMGIVPGDVIVGIENPESTEPTLVTLAPSSISEFIGAHDRITLTLESDGQTESVTLAPEAGLADGDESRPVIGVAMGFVETKSLPIHEAAAEGFMLTVTGLRDITLGIGTLLGNAITLDADLSQVAGPVGIVGLVGDAASFGFAALLMFTAFISLNLAVINLLPFPALDGGRLLFVAIEAVKGSPIKPTVAYALNAAGFALLILLMLVVTYNDILRLI